VRKGAFGRFFWVMGGVLLAALPLRAELRMPAIFGDHMVLQRERENRLWGWADPGEGIVVQFVGETFRTSAAEDGRWELGLEAREAGGPYELVVTGETERLAYSDVMVGEVWICSGQSNMAWPLSRTDYAQLETKAANHPDIRLISVPRVGTQEPQRDFEGRWERCRPDSAESFSAVGYFFGRQLSDTLGVAIGLIDNAWGGSAAEAWIRRDWLEEAGQFDALLGHWDELAETYDHEEARAEYEARLKAWEEGGREGRKPRWRGNPLEGNHRPSNIYNGVLHPILGYGIRGVIWYQGESNAGRAYQYRDLFPLLIESWRDEWGIGKFPFYYVQLADFMAERAEPQESAWAELREAQTMTMERLDNVGQAVALDLGEGRDLPPRNKRDVGLRLASWTLANDYGYDIPHRSPQFKEVVFKEGRAYVEFEHVGSGLYAFDTEEVVGFAVAGADRQFVWAEARIVDEDTVKVWSDAAPAPVAVRYAWADNPVCNLYSRDGLPATPFRTDDWQGVTFGKVK